MKSTPHSSRYPRLSLRAILLTSIPVVAIITVLVFWLSNRSIFVELQITLSLIALGLFLFLAIGLYHGVRVEKPAPIQAPVPGSSPSTSDYLFLPTNLPKINVDVPELSDTGDDLVGCLTSIVFWIVISVVAVFLLWLIEQLLILTLPAVALILYWVFYRALRVVFAQSRACRGRLLPSLGYSLLYTAFYTGWLFVIVWVSQYVIGLSKP